MYSYLRRFCVQLIKDMQLHITIVCGSLRYWELWRYVKLRIRNVPGRAVTVTEIHLLGKRIRLIISILSQTRQIWRLDIPGQICFH